MGGGAGDAAPRYIKSLYELEGFNELVNLLVPFFVPKERERVLAECAGPHSGDVLQALAMLSRDSEELALESARQRARTF